MTSKSWTIASPFEYLVPRTEKKRPQNSTFDVNVPLASSSRKSLSSCSGLLTERCRWKWGSEVEVEVEVVVVAGWR